MLKFYYNPLSVNARRVWVALLEKEIPFEPILVNLDGEQFDREFTAVNPLQRVPVIVDNGFRVIESLAIERVTSVMQFYENLLGDRLYFVGAEITLADVVAGTLVPSLPMFGFSLDVYPRLQAWLERLAMRESWQQTTPQPEVVEAALPRIRKILERRS